MKSKLTAAQKHQLLQVYLNLGIEPSRELCREWGVHPDYAAKRASEIGMSHRKIFNGSGTPSSRVDHSDPRWAWAIQRGSVVA